MGTGMQRTRLNGKIYATFDSGEGSESLPGLCLELLSEQKKAWLDLRQGCESLRDVRERDVSCGGFSVRLQYNPGRIKSSLATVGEKGADKRRCFLCPDHLPEAQKGLLYRGAYLILCNPMPIFSPHFTVSHVEHRGQAIAENIEPFLHLISEFGSGWMVFYNGPRCGASAPDHLHFQAGPAGQMPVEKGIREEERLSRMVRINGVLLYRVRDLGREVVTLVGDDPVALGEAFKGLLSALKKVLLIDEEPMMNIAGFREERKWRLVIFPRRKHRPDAFFMEGEARIVVSPGLVDMGGVLVTPMEKDFDRLDAAAVEGIYGEVSLERETVEKAIDAMG
jgi:hypothetical protein